MRYQVNDIFRCQKDDNLPADEWVSAKMCSNIEYPPKYEQYSYYEHHN